MTNTGPKSVWKLSFEMVMGVRVAIEFKRKVASLSEQCLHEMTGRTLFIIAVLNKTLKESSVCPGKGLKFQSLDLVSLSFLQRHKPRWVTRWGPELFFLVCTLFLFILEGFARFNSKVSAAFTSTADEKSKSFTAPISQMFTSFVSKELRLQRCWVQFYGGFSTNLG